MAVAPVLVVAVTGDNKVLITLHPISLTLLIPLIFMNRCKALGYFTCLLHTGLPCNTSRKKSMASSWQNILQGR